MARFKQAIGMYGLSTFKGIPIIIPNLYAHDVVDNDTSRIVSLSPINASTNTIQHFGHNSRDLSIKGRLNLRLDEGSSFASTTLSSAQYVITMIRHAKETKSMVVLMMNHGFMLGIIREFQLKDSNQYANTFDYNLRFIEKDFRGLRPNAIAQGIYMGTKSIAGIFSKGGISTFGIDPSDKIPILNEGFLK